MANAIRQSSVNSPARPGERVFAIGNSGLGRGGALWGYSEGACRITYVSTRKNNTGEELRAEFIDSSAVSLPGDSGAPLVNGRGEVVGINFGQDTATPWVQVGIGSGQIWTFLRQQAVNANVSLFLKQSDGIRPREKRLCYLLTTRKAGAAAEITHYYFVDVDGDGRCTPSALKAGSPPAEKEEP
jgi:S1-C subfamily serine protease